MRPSERISELRCDNLPGWDDRVEAYLDEAIPSLESRISALETKLATVNQAKAQLAAAALERDTADTLVRRQQGLLQNAKRACKRLKAERSQARLESDDACAMMDRLRVERDDLKAQLASNPAPQLPDGWRWFEDENSRGLERTGDLRGRDSRPFRQWKNGGYWLWFGSAGVDDVELQALAFALDKLGIAKSAEPSNPSPDWSRLLACGEAIVRAAGRLYIAGKPSYELSGVLYAIAQRAPLGYERASLLQLARYLEGGP